MDAGGGDYCDMVSSPVGSGVDSTSVSNGVHMLLVWSLGPTMLYGCYASTNSIALHVLAYRMS
jgi:hypothetical protein